MVILGLTGCIAMGKSTAAQMFRRMGIPVYDADQAVHRLMGTGGEAVAAIDAEFLGVMRDGAVNREELGRRVFRNKSALLQLEKILHPLVEKGKQNFLRTSARQKRSLVVLDIPLLFETGGEADCDFVAVVSAPPFVQIERLFKRRGMNHERIAAIRQRQMSDAEKRRRADFVIPTGLGLAVTARTIKKIIREAAQKSGDKWGRPRRVCGTWRSNRSNEYR